jgi:hypothetical protein
VLEGSDPAWLCRQHEIDMVFSLLYLAEEEESHPNLRVGGIEAYIYCALYLVLSLKRAGIESTILTNNKAALLEKCPPLERASVIELDFELDVPSDIAFRSAHHKIDIINWIGKSQADGRFLILDVDVVCVSRQAHVLLELTSKNEAGALDISNQVYSAYTHDRVQRDVRLLSGGQLAKWFGGEFLFGTALFFRRLGDELKDIWPEYIARRHDMHHQGDEMVISAALCRMLERNENILCVQPGCAIVRWWNTITAHRQVGLLSALRSELLHLPSDKNFIAFCARARVNPRYFRVLYFIYSALQMPLHRLRAQLARRKCGKAKSPPRFV